MITKVTVDYTLLFNTCTKLVDYHNDIARSCLNDDEEKGRYHLAKALYYLRIKAILFGKILGR